MGAPRAPWEASWDALGSSLGALWDSLGRERVLSTPPWQDKFGEKWGRPVGYAPTTGPFVGEVYWCVLLRGRRKSTLAGNRTSSIFFDFEI